MEKVIGRLCYNEENARYGAVARDEWIHTGFCCGETMEVYLEGKWIQSRMEMEWKDIWYLVDTPYRGCLENIPVRISC